MKKLYTTLSIEVISVAPESLLKGSVPTVTTVSSTKITLTDDKISVENFHDGFSGEGFSHDVSGNGFVDLSF